MRWSSGECLLLPVEFVLASSPLFKFVTRKQDLRPAALGGGGGGGMLSTVCPLSGQFVTLPNSNKTFFFFLLIITVTPGNSVHESFTSPFMILFGHFMHTH